ncbi:MAG: YdcF family protein [Terriglobales bacterium]
MLVLAVLGMAALFAVVANRVERQAPVDEARPAGAIIVFGAAEYVGRPSPVYRARLDHAYDLFQQGIAPLVITTGGAAKDLKFTEGGVGRDYLRSRGIPDLNLIAETQGNDTAESAARTATILRANGITDCVAVSDAYHLFRVKRMLEAQGIKVYVSPRPDSIPRTAWARAAAALREALSFFLWKLRLT